MFNDKLEKRIEDRYCVIQECLEAISERVSEIYANVEALQLLSFLKEDLKENET